MGTSDNSHLYWEARRSQKKTCADESRTNWERDYARVVHSASFRRLQSKTQVFGLGDGDFYRTRLTHSMEVSQIGVAIVKQLYRKADKNSFERKYLPHPMLMRTICLTHDIGHPPFGHSGEVALNFCMRNHGGFEGNGQTLRIITKLEKYPEYLGMDLTRRAVLGVIKYPAKYSDLLPANYYGSLDENNSKPSEYKPPKCYLDTEHEDIVTDWIAEEIEEEEWGKFASLKEIEEKEILKTRFKSLDTSIMELADDIAYGVHDLEDVIGMGLVSQKQFNDWVKEEKNKGNSLEPLLNYIGEKEDFFENKLFGDSSQRKGAIGKTVGYFVENVKFVDTNAKEHPSNFNQPLFRFQAEFKDKRVEKALKVLKDLVTKLVIKAPPVQRLEFKGQKIIRELFEAYATDPKSLLNLDDRKKYEETGSEEKQMRVICDHIAGMTDNFALNRYQQLFQAGSGSVFDRF